MLTLKVEIELKALPARLGPPWGIMTRLNFAVSILVLPFAFHSIQTQPGETKPGTATVSGRVTLKGEPARGVMIILDGRTSFPSNTHSARADENGRFRFTGVAAGMYSISAFAPGYASTKDKSHTTAWLMVSTRSPLAGS
jgi:hypothetical protein